MFLLLRREGGRLLRLLHQLHVLPQSLDLLLQLLVVFHAVLIATIEQLVVLVFAGLGGLLEDGRVLLGRVLLHGRLERVYFVLWHVLFLSSLISKKLCIEVVALANGSPLQPADVHPQLVGHFQHSVPLLLQCLYLQLSLLQLRDQLGDLVVLAEQVFLQSGHLCQVASLQPQFFNFEFQGALLLLRLHQIPL